MALPELPAQGQSPWFTPRNNWDLAVKTELEGRLSEVQLSATIADRVVEALADDPTIQAAAADAVTSDIAGRDIVETKEITTATDLHTLAPGRYWTATAGATGLISNRPPISNHPATIDVIGSGTVRTVQWTVVLAAANMTAMWEKRRDNGGNWSSWAQVAPHGIMNALSTGQDISALPAGAFYAQLTGTAGSLVGRPPGTISEPAVIEVSTAGGVRVQKWTTVPAASTGRLPRTWVRLQDNGGNWSSWVRTGFEGLQELSTGADVRALPTGQWMSQTFGVTAGLVNGPPGLSGQAIVRVTGDEGVRLVQVTEIPTAASGLPSRTWVMHRDNGGNWSSWVRTGPGTIQALSSGADVHSLMAGTYWAQTSGVAASLVNGPSIPADAATIEVVGDSGVRTIRWTTVPNAADVPRTFLKHRDNAGGWSAWRETTPGGAVGPDAGNVALRYAKAAQRPFGASDPSRWFAPVGAPITTPTHDGSGQGMHPSVLRFPGGKFGYEWWMACTPYPGFDDAHEDPNILVSTDGNTWTVPPDAPVPLDDAPGTPTAHNSDTHLVVMHDGRLAVSWRMVDRLDANKQHFYWRTYDGTTWTAKAEIFTSASLFVSQALVQDGPGWRMYGINASRDLVYYSTTNPTPGPADWTGPTACPTTPGPAADRDWWHVDVQNVGGSWWGIVSDVPKGATGDYGDIFLMRSSDGVNWDVAVTPLTPRLQANSKVSIDSLYKTGFVVGAGTTPDLDVFLSGYSAAGRGWSTWRTTAKPI